MRAGMNDTRTRCDACGVELRDGPRALFRNPSLRGCCEECARLGDEGTLLCGGCAHAVGYADLWGTAFGWPYDLTWHLDDTCAQRLWDARWMPDRMTIRSWRAPWRKASDWTTTGGPCADSANITASAGMRRKRMRRTVCSGTHESGVNTNTEQIYAVISGHNRFHVLLTMPDGTYRTIMNATAEEHDSELRVYATDTIVLFSLDGNGLLYPIHTDRLPMLGLDALPVKFEPFPPYEYPIMRLADGQSFPIREIPDMDDTIAKVGIPGPAGLRFIPMSNVTCIDPPSLVAPPA